MQNIAIIDDRVKLRETIVRLVEASLPEGWQCHCYAPLNNLQDYHPFINDNRISVLVLDELLHEQAEDSDSHVGYDGHAVAEYLRGIIPEFPIHIITSYKDHQDLLESEDVLDSIYDRNEFIKNSKNIVPRLVRSAMKFIEVNQAKVAELTRLAQKKAAEKLNDEEEERILALQEELNLKIYNSQDSEAASLVDNIEQNIRNMDTLLSQINAMLRK